MTDKGGNDLDERAGRKAEVVGFVFKKKFKGFKKKDFEKDWEAKVKTLAPNISSLNDDEAGEKLQQAAEELRLDYSKKYEMKKGRMPKA